MSFPNEMCMVNLVKLKYKMSISEKVLSLRYMWKDTNYYQKNLTAFQIIFHKHLAEEEKDIIYTLKSLY